MKEKKGEKKQRRKRDRIRRRRRRRKKTRGINERRQQRIPTEECRLHGEVRRRRMTGQVGSGKWKKWKKTWKKK